MDRIEVQVELASSLSAVPAEVVKLDVTSKESEAARKLKLALKVSGLHHTYSFAQKIGIYPT